MRATDKLEKVYEFGTFRLVPSEGLLLQAGESINLNPKSFAVLTLLVERHGHLVSKSEILDSIWEDTFVEESVIPKSISNLRSILGDTSKEKYIQTIPKRGYRFVAPVKVLNDSVDGLQVPAELISTGFRLRLLRDDGDGEAGFTLAEELPAHAIPAEVVDDTKAPPARFGAIAAIAGVAILLLGGAFVYFVLRDRSANDAARIKKIAVLPVRPVDAQARDQIYELGIADALIQKLNTARGLSVRQLNVVREYTDLDQDPLNAGREQKVDFVVSSHYQVANGKIKVTAQLQNVTTGEVEESLSADADIADAFVAQEVLANKIGNRLLIRFGSDRKDVAAKWGTSNQEAYRLYQQGTDLVDKRNGAKAIESFDAAIQLDPNYAAAWAGKALALRVSASRGGGTVDVHEMNKLSTAALERALALDADLPFARAALCGNKTLYEYDLAGAEAECARAVRLDPGFGFAHLAYADLLSALGRFEEAVAEIDTAIELEPKSILSQRIRGHILFRHRRFGDAEKQLLHVDSLEGNPSTMDWIGWVYELQGRQAEAFEAYVKRLADKDPESVQAFRKAHQESGWQGFLKERVDRSEATGRAYYTGAFYCIQAGETDKAFANLEKAFERREVWLAWIKVDPRLDPIRDDPRYADLIRRIERR